MPNALSHPPVSHPPANAPAALTSQQRAGLRAAAHGLRPVVLVGERGLSEAVIKEIDRALSAHSLIKVRAGSQERSDRDAMLVQLCAQLGCQPVHHLGKTLILYRAPQQAAEPGESDGLRKRKASEPYTPKKRAAVGKSVGKNVGKTAGKTQAATPKARPARPTTPASSTARAAPVRKTTKTTRSTQSASALTLRAGVRSSTRGSSTRAPARSLSRSVGVAKAPARKTSPRSR